MGGVQVIDIIEEQKCAFLIRATTCDFTYYFDFV